MTAPMSAAEAALILRAHNAWRAGYGQSPDPELLTLALDMAAAALGHPRWTADHSLGLAIEAVTEAIREGRA